VFKDLLNTFSQGLFWQPGKEKKSKLLKLQSSNETLASSIKQSTQQRGKGRERERSKVATDVQIENARAFLISMFQDLSNDTKNTPQRDKTTNYVPKPPSVTRSI